MTVQPTRDQLRALADKATEGPWYAERRREDYYDLTTVYNVFHNGDTMDRDLVAEVAYDNAEFIAAAREAVPALLDALAVAEHRATRAEEKVPEEKALRMRAVAAVTEAEADRDEWRQAALEERAGLLDALDQLKVRDARVQAALMVLDEDTRWQNDTHILARIRTALTR